MIGARSREPDAADAIVRLCLAPAGCGPTAALEEAARQVADWIVDPANRQSFIPHPALLGRALRTSGLTLPAPLRTKIEAAGLREERRSAIAAGQFEHISALLADAGVDCPTLRGWPLARDLYPEPMARHCHALRWYVPDDTQIDRILALLATAGWTTTRPAPLLAPHKIIVGGDGRVIVELHKAIFPWTARLPDLDTITSIEFALVEMIGAALVEGPARWGLWKIDTVQLLRRHRIDAGRFADIATEYGIPGTAWRALNGIQALIPAAEPAVDGQIDALKSALGHRGSAPPRDARAVADLLTVLRMSGSSTFRLLLRSILRPDLARRGWALRRDRRLRGIQAEAMRDTLRGHHQTNRV